MVDTAAAFPSPAPILAETVAVDTEVVVAILLVMSLIGLTALVVAVLGIVCGVRYGRDASAERAATVWRFCLSLQALGAAVTLYAVISNGWTPIAVVPILAPALTYAAFAFARGMTGGGPAAGGGR